MKWNGEKGGSKSWGINLSVWQSCTTEHHTPPLPPKESKIKITPNPPKCMMAPFQPGLICLLYHEWKPAHAQVPPWILCGNQGISYLFTYTGGNNDLIHLFFLSMERLWPTIGYFCSRIRCSHFSNLVAWPTYFHFVFLSTPLPLHTSVV